MILFYWYAIKEADMEPKNILITGNGFDLALGFKTKYEDFMNFVKRAKELEYEDFVSFVKNEWKIENCDSKEIDSFYQLLKKNNDNFIINYFENYHSKTLTWADFELELLHIGQCLESILLALQNDNSKIIGDNIWLPYEGDLKYYSNYLMFMNDNIVFYINPNVFVDKIGERWLVLNIKNEPNIQVQSDVEIKVLKIFDRLPKFYYENILLLSDLFKLYLGIESKRNCSILKPRYSINGVVTYNYTDFYDEISDLVFHVNGAFAKKDESIIFGVDSNANFRTSYFLASTKEIQRASNGIKIDRISSICDKLDNIYIFGFSLTTADADSIKLIFQKVKERFGLCRVTIFYKSQNNRRDDLLERMVLNTNLRQILGDDYSLLINSIFFVDSIEFFEQKTSNEN